MCRGGASSADPNFPPHRTLLESTSVPLRLHLPASLARPFRAVIAALATACGPSADLQRPAALSLLLLQLFFVSVRAFFFWRLRRLQQAKASVTAAWGWRLPSRRRAPPPPPAAPQVSQTPAAQLPGSAGRAKNPGGCSFARATLSTSNALLTQPRRPPPPSAASSFPPPSKKPKRPPPHLYRPIRPPRTERPSPLVKTTTPKMLSPLLAATSAFFFAYLRQALWAL